MAPERIRSIDTVRGVAVLGILLINIISFGLPSALHLDPTAGGDTSPTDRAVWALTFVAIDGKMRALFAMLFGASMLLVADKAAPPDAAGQHVRRMLILLAIGLLHAFLFWQGDILVHYSLIGLLLFPLWQKSPSALFMIAVALLALQAAIHFSLAVQGGEMRAAAMAPGASETRIEDFRHFDFASSGTPEAIAEEVEAVRGSFAEGFARRRAELAFTYTLFFPLMILFETSAQMLIGMALFRLGWWQGALPRPAYWRLAALAVPLGLAGMALVARRYAASDFQTEAYFRAEGWRVLIGPWIALGYAALVILLVQAGGLPRLVARLSAVGQMALSNYLATTLVCSLLFQGWGLGLFGAVGRAELYLVVLGVWALLLGWSKPWLDTHSHGPAEWLWRTLSTGRRQAWRRAPHQ